MGKSVVKKKCIPRSAAVWVPPIERLRLIRAERARLVADLDAQQLDAVTEALDARHTFVEVARALGVTTQAAHKRYGPRVRPPS